MHVVLHQSTWATIAIAGVACHFALFGLLHWLQPQLSPKSSIISDYSQTSSARIATSAFVAFAVVWFALAIALSRVTTGNILLTSGRALFALAVVGIVAGTLFPSAADPRTPSVLAKLENLIARPGLFLGIVLVSVGLREASGWEDLWPWLVFLSLLALALLAITIAVLLERGLGGIGQRCLFALVYVWVVLVSAHILAQESHL